MNSPLHTARRQSLTGLVRVCRSLRSSAGTARRPTLLGALRTCSWRGTTTSCCRASGSTRWCLTDCLSDRPPLSMRCTRYAAVCLEASPVSCRCDGRIFAVIQHRRRQSRNAATAATALGAVGGVGPSRGRRRRMFSKRSKPGCSNICPDLCMMSGGQGLLAK